MMLPRGKTLPPKPTIKEARAPAPGEAGRGLHGWKTPKKNQADRENLARVRSNATKALASSYRMANMKG